MDLYFNDNIEKAHAETRRIELPIPDELNRGLKKLRREGEISAWIVFASRVLLDIKDIVGDKMGQSFHHMTSVAKTSKEKLHSRVQGIALITEGEQWATRDGPAVLKLFENCQIMAVPFFQKMKESWLREMAPQNQMWHSLDSMNAEQREAVQELMKARGIDFAPPELQTKIQQFNIETIKPSTIPSFIYAANPIYCGLRSFELALDTEYVGLALANHHQSIYLVAHLYNAMLQTDILKIRWPLMDRIIELHIGTYFAGKLPETEKDITSRCTLQLGFSAQGFARNPRNRNKTTFKHAFRPGMENGPQIAPTKMAQIFRQYFQKQKTIDQCLYALEAHIQNETAHSQSGSQVLITKQQGKKPKLYHRQLTPLQLLSHIQSYLPSCIPAMQIDYLTLVRTCNALLRDIRSTINAALSISSQGVVHPEKTAASNGGDSYDGGLLIMVLDILNEAADCKDVQDDVLRGKLKRRILRGGPQLDLAGVVVTEFIEKLLEKEGKGGEKLINGVMV